MKKLIALCVILSLPALAVVGADVKYVGGTQPGLTAGVSGHLDTTAKSSLIFENGAKKLAIPYESIQSFEYSKEVSRELGVLPTIAVGLLKPRQHRHLFRIVYRIENSNQVAIFEVPKEMPRVLQAVLEARGAHLSSSLKPRGCSGIDLSAPQYSRDTPKTIPDHAARARPPSYDQAGVVGREPAAGIPLTCQSPSPYQGSKRRRR